MNISNLWFGSAESILPFERYLDYLAASSHADIKMYMEREEDEEEELDLPEIAQIEGSVGILRIEGSLIPNSNWLTRLFGMTGYDDIVEAAVALRDEGVSSIVLSINSGGGSVTGLEAAGNVLKLVGKDVPIYANTEGGMMSAAYWLGSISREISGTGMSQVGSIGTVITHVSVARALKESGRDVKIIRSGKYKALGHPAEKLSKEAEQKLQAEADTMTGFFRDHVVEQRVGLLGNWDTWGEGKTFFLSDAISVGLADRIANLNQLVTRLNSKAETEENTDMTKKRVILQDEAAVAQLESGVPLESVAHQEVEETEVSAAEESTSPVEADAEVESNIEAAEATDEVAAEAADKSDTESSLIAHLKTDIRELRSELSIAQARNINLTSKLESLQAGQAALKDIAATSANKMQIGLGQKPSDMSALSVDALVEQHAAIQQQFHEQFRVGQQTVDTPVDESAKAEVLPMSLGIFPKTKNA